ncbi:Uncharacterised protein [Candidatus Gugararchaeum adminiculabundum]|nr:Uncharacterised protein [Candidatus Gugararchaeum adminiculabundum]
MDSKMLRKILLICGILSSVLYVGTDIFAAMQIPGYSYLDQAISELSAIGAQTRPLWIAMSFIYAPLVIAFGIGVLKSAGENRSLRITGILLSIWGTLGFVWLLFPMHMRGAIGSFTDTMHLVMSGVTVLLIIAMIGFGSGTQGKWFRIYSILTILAMLIFGALVGQQAPSVAAQLPTPWMGVMERVSVYSSMLWVLVLGVVLLRKNSQDPINLSDA